MYPLNCLYRKQSFLILFTSAFYFQNKKCKINEILCYLYNGLTPSIISPCFKILFVVKSLLVKILYMSTRNQTWRKPTVGKICSPMAPCIFYTTYPVKPCSILPHCLVIKWLDLWTLHKVTIFPPYQRHVWEIVANFVSQPCSQQVEEKCSMKAGPQVSKLT